MTALADREWRLIPERADDGPTTMALEEVAAETAVEDGVRTVRVYSWEPSTLSLGYRQDPDTVDWAYCERRDIGVTRRQTGGGGIYHDRHADISYSIVAPADELPGDLMDSYDLLCEPVLDAFERLGVPAAFADEELPAVHQPCCYLRSIHPAHDILADGRKISGNAQYRQRDAVIQHGSLSFDLATEDHLGVFSDPQTTPAEFRERVTAISEHADVTREDAVDALETALAEWADADEGAWREDELDRAGELAAEKYGTDDWTRRRTVPDAVE
ncbi:lipoate-protein ligase A [Natronoarchaeum philippinense]|uniref:Lipoate-protein ligase A n=1 Tax=Natronoarchaeum philippinense TaxID=558529 RepID=A0A285NSV9_NATPI|nr:biotin/lipoate A/B protein ligase family protein [Natronoarchaeum philippinense]SNZ12545.1 lipoate-protein ligase A [Natronoarchaeum philippinense]